MGDIVLVRSDKDTHFAGAIAQDAVEAESLTIPDIRITRAFLVRNVALQADQNLDFSVMFFSTSGHDNTDLDLDTFIGSARIDLSTTSLRIATNQYYGSSQDMGLVYIDETFSGAQPQLHVALHNGSVTGKNAGATGEVVIAVTLETMP